MRLGQPLGNLRRDFNCFSYWQQAGDKQLAQRLPLYQLHRNVVSGTVLSNFVDGNDIGVVEGRGGFGLTAKPYQVHGILSDLFRKNLQCHEAVQTGILGLVHHPHPAASGFFDQPVMSDDVVQG